MLITPHRYICMNMGRLLHHSTLQWNERKKKNYWEDLKSTKMSKKNLEKIREQLIKYINSVIWYDVTGECLVHDM